MDNTKKSPVTCMSSEMFPARKPLPVFRVGIWARDTDGSLCYIAEDVASANSWSAVGYQMLHLRATNPGITLRPDGISVVRVPGERMVQPDDEAVIQ